MHRSYLLAVCALLVALAFHQESGRIAPDTKLDLVVDPGRFLARSLHLWDAQGAFGQVQNQAYGYLFPMGPFFWLGHAVGLDPWVVQRLWVSALLCTAFLGTVRLARLMGIGTPWTRVAGGLAFALAPRMMTLLGAASVEALPMALAPWVLVPLVGTGRARVRAMRSGVAVLLAGGVNAAAAAAVLPLPVLFLLTRPRGPERRRLAVWWAVAVLLATLWWLLPLVILGRYSPPFLDYIESAATTTSVTNLGETLRGTSHWLAFLADGSGPVWRAGWALVTTPVLVLDTAVVAAFGAAGLVDRRMPHRAWLGLGALAGVVMVTFGHVGPWPGLLSSPVGHVERDLLDGALAPLRNVHKYDVVLRLPLVLGAVHLLARIQAGLRSGQVVRGLPRSLPRIAVGAATVALLAALAEPLLAGVLVPRGSFTEVPGYWRQTATWLDEPGRGGRALLVPASRFGTYYWGDPRDEPLQALADSAWGVRDAIPLTPPGTIRALDAVERQFASGQPTDGLAPYLQRSGVRWLVVRNDLDYARAQSVRPVLVHQVLEESPGITRVTSFGPTVGGGSTLTTQVDQQLDRPYPAVEVYEVDAAGPESRVSAWSLSDVAAVSGGPESLLSLEERGWLGQRPAVLAGDLPPWLYPTTAVLTDGMRRREQNFGRIDASTSATLTTDDPLRMSAAARDYLPWPDGAHETVAVLSGARAVRASSSSSDANAFGGAHPEHQPFAAVDGDASTSWLSSGNGGAVGSWLELDLGARRDIRTVRLQRAGDAPGPVVTRAAVSTSAGSVDIPLGAAAVTVPLPRGTTDHVRVTAVAVAGGGRGFTFGLSNLSLPGVHVTRTLWTPADAPAAETTAVALDTGTASRPGCVRVGGRPLCALGIAVAGEESTQLARSIDLPTAAALQVSATVTPRPGPTLSGWLRRTAAGLQVTPSSVAVADPVADGQSVADGDVGTGWVAAAGDARPTLTVTLPRSRRVDGVQVLVDGALAASRPTVLAVSAGGQTRVVALDAEGGATFAALPAGRSVSVRVLGAADVSSYDPFTRQVSRLPVGMSELRLLGADDLRRETTDATFSLACGEGPDLVVDGHRVRTRLDVTRTQLLRLSPVSAVACGPVEDLTAGRHNVSMASTALWSARSVSLTSGSMTSVPQPEAVSVRRWSADSRSVALPARTAPTLVVVHENVNGGWRASYDGKPVRSVTVDGWQQGYVVPAGDAGLLRLDYAPDRTYRLALLAGGIGAAVLLALTVGRRSHHPPAEPEHPAPPRNWGVPVLVVASAVALGLVTAAVAAGTVWLMRGSPRRQATLPYITAVVLATGGALLALHPWPGPGYLGSGALVAAVSGIGLGLVLAAVIDHMPTHPRRRSAGRSSHR